MVCQATSGASESRQRAPKSRLSASAVGGFGDHRRMHGHDLAVVAAAEGIGPEHDHGLDGELAQGRHPVAQDAVQADTVKVNRDPHAFRSYHRRAVTISPFDNYHERGLAPGQPIHATARDAWSDDASALRHWASERGAAAAHGTVLHPSQWRIRAWGLHHAGTPAVLRGLGAWLPQPYESLGLRLLMAALG